MCSHVTELNIQTYGENPTIEQKHLIILHPFLLNSRDYPNNCPQIFLSFHHLIWFSISQTSVCKIINVQSYRHQILFTALHGQFQDISRVFSGPLCKLEQGWRLNPTWTCLAERAMRTESQPASYCLVDSPEKKRCLFTIHLSRETDHFRNDCRIYIFRYKSTVHFYTSSLWNICFELLLNHLCISRILFSAYKKTDSFSLKDGKLYNDV